MSPQKARIITLDEFNSNTPEEPIWLGTANYLSKDDLLADDPLFQDNAAIEEIQRAAEESPEGICMAIWLQKNDGGLAPIFMAPLDPGSLTEPPIVASLRVAFTEAQISGFPPPRTLVVRTEEEGAALKMSNLAKECKVVVEPENDEIMNYCASIFEDFLHASKDDVEKVCPVPGINGVTEEMTNKYFEIAESFTRAQAWKLGNKVDSFLILLPEDDYCLGILMNERGEDPGVVLVPIPKPDKENPVDSYFNQERPYLCLRLVQHPICSEEILEHIFNHAPYFRKCKYTPYVESLDTENNLLAPTAQDHQRITLTAATLIAVKEGVKAKQIKLEHEASLDIRMPNMGKDISTSICFYDRGV